MFFFFSQIDIETRVSAYYNLRKYSKKKILQKLFKKKNQ